MSSDLSYRRKVESLIDEWRAGATPNAREAMLNIPEVQGHRSVSIDLAYEEYCLRKEAGQDIDTLEFCKQFPTIHQSLLRMLDVHRCLQSFAISTPVSSESEWPKVGELWLDWKLVEVMGRGSFSRVFLAEEPALGDRHVVVKCSHAGPKEAYILGRLSHPNVVPIHSIRIDHDRALAGICMPLLGDRTLAALLDEIQVAGVFRPLSKEKPASHAKSKATSFSLASKTSDEYVNKVLLLVEQLADGLIAAHERGVVHGDIKPSNIIIAFDGKPMLVDFNLAVDARKGQQLFGGTPPYMAPEAFQRLSEPTFLDGTQANERCDQFSLGAVLFELLTGKLPYELDFENPKPTYRDTRDEVYLQHSAIQFEPSLRNILHRCLAYDPEKRFATVRDFSKALHSVRHAIQRRLLRRRMLRLAAVGGVCLAIGGSLAAAGIIASQESPRQRQLRSAIANIKIGDYYTAAQQLADLNQETPTQGLAAWAAYCYAKEDWNSAASAFNGFALATDDPSGRIWNNLGLSNLQLGHLSGAEEQFTQAIEKDPRLQAPFVSRARLRLRRAMQQNLPNTDALHDVERAFGNGPESAGLHFLAASNYAYAMSKGLPVERSSVERHIVRGLELGEPVQNFEKSHIFSEFEISELLKRANPKPGVEPLRPEVLLLPPTPLEDELPKLADK